MAQFQPEAFRAWRRRGKLPESPFSSGVAFFSPLPSGRLIEAVGLFYFPYARAMGVSIAPPTAERIIGDLRSPRIHIPRTATPGEKHHETFNAFFP
ncbi:MAG: hypothetical protein JW849_06550 [Phycisphaerae bacterium]|nr:hypothetical protein [Phycisphaerae bacterium]